MLSSWPRIPAICRCVASICDSRRVGLHLEILDPVALADDRAERGELRHRALHLRDRDAERDLRRADALRRRLVLERGDAAAVRERDLLRALRRAGERLDVVDAQAQLRLVALELAGGRAERPRLFGCGGAERPAPATRSLSCGSPSLGSGGSWSRVTCTRRLATESPPGRARRASGRSPSPRRARGPASTGATSTSCRQRNRARKGSRAGSSADSARTRSRSVGWCDGLRGADLVQQRLRHGCSPSLRASSGRATGAWRPPSG